MTKARSKKSTKKVQRHYPVQRTIQLKDLDENPSIPGGRLMRGASILSGANRRLYREPRVYSMKLDIEPGSTLATAGVSVYVLRDTWDLHGAYKMAMKKYYNAMKEEIATAGGGVGRWHDFRVFPEFQGPELTGVISGPDPIVGSAAMLDSQIEQETEFSTVVDQNGDTRTFSLRTGGTTVNQYGIMQEWQFADRVDADPESPGTSLPYDGLNPGQDEANYDILKTKGDTPPYSPTSQTFQWRRVGVLKESSTGASKFSTGYFDAPLGIVVLVSSTFTASEQAYALHVTFQSGDYKGVKAPAYATPVLTEEMEYEVV